MDNKRGKGQPRSFKDEKEFEQKFIEYIDYCNKMGWLPNVAGFCVYCDINRSTFYAQKQYYSNTYKKIDTALENFVINNKHISPTEKIFYLKSKFKYIDKQVVESVNKNINIYEALSDEELEKALNEFD